MAYVGLTIVALIFMGIGLMLAGTGDTTDLKYGLFLDRAAVIVMVGTLLMVSVPAWYTFRQKAWLQFGVLCALFVVMSPLIFPGAMLFLGVIGIAKPLGMMGFPTLFALIFHAVLVYWIGFQRTNSRLATLEADLESRRRKAQAAHDQADVAQNVLNDAQSELDRHNRLVEDADTERQALIVRKDAAQAAHDQFVKQDKTVSAAERELKRCTAEYEVLDKIRERARDRFMNAKADPTGQQKTDYDQATATANAYEMGELEDARVALERAKNALEHSQTGTALATCKEEEQRLSDAHRDAVKRRKPVEKHRDAKSQDAGTTARVAERADKAVREAQDKLNTARQGQNSRRGARVGAWLLATAGVLALYSAYWGAILLRP